MYTVMPRILCVDDEPHVLDGLARTLRRHFDVTLAEGGDAGLDRVEREGPFAVVVSDQRMPGTDGVTFLSRVREVAPDTVRILLTGYADTAAAMAAVNRGAVFRFLSKPIETAELLQTLNLAAEQHRLITAERVLLERTLHGSIKAIIDVLALVNPAGFGRALRAKETVAALSAAVGGIDGWQVEVAAMISQVGAAAVSAGAALPSPPAPGAMPQLESATVGRLSRIAADMVASIPRMEEVHAMLTHQDLRYDGSNAPSPGPREQAIPLGARMLKVAFDLDVLEAQGMARPAAVQVMRDRWGWYDPQLLDVLAPRGGSGAAPSVSPAPAAAPAPAPTRQEAAPTHVLREVEMRMLEEGMILDEEVRTRGGRVLIARGQAATWEAIRQVKGSFGFTELRQSVRVREPAPTTAPSEEPAAATPPPSRSSVSAGGMELDLTMRLTV